MPRDADRPAPDTSTDDRAGVLLGRDHPQPGAMATVRVSDTVGLGIARGWRPKPYAYVDPNEDAVGAVADDRAQLLVVADGHNGHHASHVVVERVVDLLDDLPPADLSDDELVDIALTADRAATAVPRRASGRSRTTLVVALRTPGQLQWVGIGDSALLVVEALQARQLDTFTRWFCGDGVDADTAYRTVARGRVAVGARAWVVLATDGYTDYLPVPRPPADATRAFLRDATAPEHAAELLLRQARRGGAGDNVAVAVSAPW